MEEQRKSTTAKAKKEFAAIGFGIVVVARKQVKGREKNNCSRFDVPPSTINKEKDEDG